MYAVLLLKAMITFQNLFFKNFDIQYSTFNIQKKDYLLSVGDPKRGPLTKKAFQANA